MSKFETDLTSGSVAKRLLVFAIPFMLSNIIQSFYNIADMLIVGRFVGTYGISGVNIGGQVTFIMTNIAISICTGGTIIIAQYMGAKKRKDAKEAISTLLTLLLGMAVLITTLMLVFDDFVLQLVQTPAESYQYAKDYLAITILGCIFIFGYNALSGIMRGMGDSKTPLYLVTGACIINIVLDLLFIGVFGMEVRGAAVATVISQAFSMFMCIFYLMKSDFMFDFKLSSFKIKRDKLKLITSTGMPIVIQNVLTNLSFLTMTGLANGIGVTASASLGVVSRYNGFAIMPSAAVGASISAMVAQNMGAGDIKRAKETMWTGIVISYLVSIPLFLAIRIFPDEFIGLFDKSPELIASGVEYLSYFSLEYLIVPVFFALMGLITGSGHTLFSSVVGVASSIGIRMPLAIIFVRIFDLGLAGIGLSAPIASFSASLVALAYYFSGKWQKQVIVKSQPSIAPDVL